LSSSSAVVVDTSVDTFQIKNTLSVNVNNKVIGKKIEERYKNGIYHFNCLLGDATIIGLLVISPYFFVLIK